MNWLRRLFGRPIEVPANGVSPAAAGVKTPEAVLDDDETVVARPLPTQPLAPPDGGTRPLANDPLPDITTSQHIAFAQASDVGMLRSNNQDAAVSFFSATRSVDDRPDFGLFAIADGMGGHHDGEKASALAVRTLLGEVMTSLFLPMLNGLSRHVGITNSQSCPTCDPEGMGPCTAACASSAAGFSLAPIDGGMASCHTGRLKSAMSTTSNSASLRRSAMDLTHWATSRLWRPGRTLPVTMAIFVMTLLDDREGRCQAPQSSG